MRLLLRVVTVSALAHVLALACAANAEASIEAGIALVEWMPTKAVCLQLSFIDSVTTPPAHAGLMLASSADAFAPAVLTNPDSQVISGELMASAAVRWSSPPSSAIEATLSTRVAHIVSPRSDEEVIRVTARRVIAAVTDVAAGWNGAMREHPSNAMRGGLASASNSDASVTAFQSRAIPRPATLWSARAIDVGPQAIVDSALNGGHEGNYITLVTRGSRNPFVGETDAIQ